MQLPGFKLEPEIEEVESAEVEMRIRGLMLDPTNRQPIVVLNDLSGEVVLPIWVGLFEAQAIALEIEKASTPRPMTHDLLLSVISGLNATVTRVVVDSLREDTFYATVWMRQESGPFVVPVGVDARPSDAIALALRSDCPIFVSRELFEYSRKTNAAGQSFDPETVRRWLENLGDDEMGRYKM